MFNLKGPQGQNPRTTCGPRTTVWEAPCYSDTLTSAALEFSSQVVQSVRMTVPMHCNYWRIWMNAILRIYGTMCEIWVSQRNVYEKYYPVRWEAKYQRFEITCCLRLHRRTWRLQDPPKLMRLSRNYSAKQITRPHCRKVLKSHTNIISTRVGTLIVATIYLQLIQNRYVFRSFTVLQCSHQRCVQPVTSDVEVVGYL